MTSELTDTGWAFQFNEGIFQKATSGIAADQWLMMPGEHSHPLVWVAGHLVWARGRILQRLGHPWSKPWLEQFARGGAPLPVSQYPKPAEVMQAWTEVSGHLRAALEAASPELLAQPAPEGTPSSDGKLSGVLEFFVIHEGYHLGQMGYLRKWLGHPGALG